MSEVAGFTRDKLDAVMERLAEPEWLRQRRRDAYEQFVGTPLPTTSDEDWRRTDLSRVDLAKLAQPVAPNGGAAGGSVAADCEELGGCLTFADGAVTSQRLDDDLRDAGVVFCSLHEALEQHGDLIQQSFMTQAVLPHRGKFTLLHAAFWTSGTFLYVPSGVEVAKPLLSQVHQAATGVAHLHHTLVIAEDRARVALVEEVTGGAGGESLSVPVVEVLGGRDSNVGVTSAQNQEGMLYEFATKWMNLGDNASGTFCLSTLGGAIAKSFVGATLAGQGANVDLVGCYFPQRGQHIDTTTYQDHPVPNGLSNLLFKGALADRARSIFRGVINVHKDAQQTDAYQTNNNLLLGDRARADSMPVLEISADDVKCSHGATLAHLDKEDLFYLQSRGLDLQTAQRMVIDGFFMPVLQYIPAESARERIHEAFGSRIQKQTGR